MRHIDIARIDIATITSFDGVLAELRKLDEELSSGNLEQLITFNKAYTIVTRMIKNAAENNYFENPVFVEKFTVCFAGHYFQAINDIVSGSSKLPVAWAKMNSANLVRSTPVFITLLMGANAHINHDLPLALARFMAKEGQTYSLHDVRKVDKLLMKSGKQIIDTFDERASLLNTMKRRLRVLYYRPVMYTILYWRIIAWRNYKAIKKDGEAKHDYKNRSIKIADRLLRLGKFLSKL